MPASKTSGTWLDFLKSIESKHYLTTKAKSLNPADDTEPAWVVFDGPGDEDYQVYQHPDNDRFSIAVGYDANTATQSFRGTFKNGTIHSSAYSHPPPSHTSPITWWFYSGGGYYWVVGQSDARVSDDVFTMGWQEVSQYWPYHERYDAARVAMVLYSEAGAVGWDGTPRGHYALIDSTQSGSNTTIIEQDHGQPMLGGLSQANTWRATDGCTVIKRDGHPQIAGTINAWGFDPQKDSVIPAHETEFSAGGRSYQYIRPVSDSWDSQPIFFRTG